MDCNQIAELAPLYLSGELDRERAGAVDAHLRSCSSCLQEFESQAGLDARTREVIAAEPVDATGVELWIRARIATELRGKVAPISLERSRRRWFIAAVGTAAVLLLIAAGYRVLMTPNLGRVYADAALDHQREVVEDEPRRWLSDRPSVSALAEGQGIPASAPFALSSGPYRLERARLCFLDGRIFLHVVYTDGTREFSVYFRVRGDESLPASPRGMGNGNFLHSSIIGSEQVACFQTKALTVVAVSDRYSGDALRAARLAATTL
jgi:Putative zinc-finger